jgi:hypothetical protein
VNDENPLLPAPCCEVCGLLNRTPCAEAGNGKLNDRLRRLGNTLEPASRRAQAGDVNAPPPPIEAADELDHLTFRPPGSEGAEDQDDRQ